MTVLGAGSVMGIVRYRQPADLDATLEALAHGGIRLVEITLDTPGAIAAIGRAARAGRVVGAGTVLTADDVRAAAGSGATFVVSPACIPAVIETALELGVEPIPGVLSPTELVAATAAGARSVKLFPAGPAGGPAFVRALRGPFPEPGLLPTGGIGVDEVGAYLAAGATCVGLGASLVGSSPLTDAGAFEDLRRRAAAAVGAAP